MAIFSSDDEDEDPYGDPLFTGELSNRNGWEGNRDDKGNTEDEWDDWNETANYFDDEEEAPDDSTDNKNRVREVEP